MIQTNAESLLNYVNSILELSRLESGKIQYEDEECDIIQLCSEVLDKVNGREESTVSVSLQTDLKEQLARTDRRWFDTLLVSMLLRQRMTLPVMRRLSASDGTALGRPSISTWSTPRLQRYILRIKRA